VRSGTAALGTVAVAAATAATITVCLDQVRGPIGLGTVAFVLLWIGFSLWPWAVLPVGVLGVTVAAVLADRTDVRSIVVIHMVTLAAGAVALVTRRAFGADRDASIPRLYIGSMATIVGVVAIGAVYGLALGNELNDVVVGGYQVIVVPMYFVATILTLDTEQRRRHAATLYIATIGVLTVLELATPGRHGGQMSLMPIPLLIVLAGRARGWKRVGYAVLAVELAADVVLASFRGVWVAAGIAVAVLAVCGDRVVRRGLAAVTAASVIALATFGIVVGLSSGLRERASVVGDVLGRSAGYRASESRIGWEVFLSRPLFGGGTGQSTAPTYLPGFEITSVGPTYHSYFILLLANLGVIGFCAVLWPIVRSIWTGGTSSQPVPLAFAALTSGFLVAAAFSGPTDGHWELGVLPALTLLTLVPAARSGNRYLAVNPRPHGALVGASR